MAKIRFPFPISRNDELRGGSGWQRIERSLQKMAGFINSGDDAITAAVEAAEAAQDAAETAASTAMSGTPEGYSDVLASIAEEFNATKAYPAGTYVWRNSKLYLFISDHSIGSWTGTDATEVVISNKLTDSNFALTKEIIPGINGITRNNIITFEKGYINTSVSSVDITTIVDANAGTFLHAVVPCNAGDIFTINGNGAGAARLWAFIKSDGERLDVAGSGATGSNLIKTAPANSAYLVINVRTSSTSIVCYKNVSLHTTVNDNIRQAVLNHYGIYDALDAVADGNLIDKNLMCTGTLNPSTGDVIYNASDYTSYYIPINTDKYYITYYQSGVYWPFRAVRYAFYDASLTFTHGGTTSDAARNITPASGDVYVRIADTVLDRVIMYDTEHAAPSQGSDYVPAHYTLSDITTLQSDMTIALDGVNKYAQTYDYSDSCLDFSSTLIDASSTIDNFIYFTDPHTVRASTEATFYKPFMDNSAVIAGFYNRLPVQYVLCGGDWLGADDTQQMAIYKMGWVTARMRELFGDHYYPAYGNHDNNMQGATEMTLSEVIDTTFPRQGKAYYSFKEQTGRIYVLDTGSDWSTDMSDYRWAQIAWLAEELADKDDDYAAICMHICWNTDSAENLTPMADNVQQLIGAYNSHSTIELNEIEYDFTTCSGSVKFILCGHIHDDKDDTSNYSVPIIASINTTAENIPSFDLVSVDWYAGTLKMIRVGTGSSRNYTI